MDFPFLTELLKNVPNFYISGTDIGTSPAPHTRVEITFFFEKLEFFHKSVAQTFIEFGAGIAAPGHSGIPRVNAEIPNPFPLVVLFTAAVNQKETMTCGTYAQTPAASHATV
jgi:hypothetical protein